MCWTKYQFLKIPHTLFPINLFPPMSPQAGKILKTNSPKTRGHRLKEDDVKDKIMEEEEGVNDKIVEETLTPKRVRKQELGGIGILGPF